MLSEIGSLSHVGIGDHPVRLRCAMHTLRRGHEPRLRVRPRCACQSKVRSTIARRRPQKKSKARLEERKGTSALGIKIGWRIPWDTQDGARKQFISGFELAGGYGKVPSVRRGFDPCGQGRDHCAHATTMATERPCSARRSGRQAERRKSWAQI